MEETEEKEAEEYDVDSDVEEGTPSPVVETPLFPVLGMAIGRKCVAELTDEGGE